MKFEQIHSVQEWLPYDKILENGVIKLKDSSYIKIINISPINYILKSNLEKEAILDSYKNIFKSCDFNMQILIQSKKEDLNIHIKNLRKNNLYPKIKKEYIEYLNNFIKNRKTSNKNFYLIIKSSPSDETEEAIIKKLEDNYRKIKDLFLRCGNFISDYTEENQIVEILFSFINSK